VAIGCRRRVAAAGEQGAQRVAARKPEPPQRGRQTQARFGIAPQDEVVEARLARTEDNARHLYDRGDLREGLSLAQGRDVMWPFSSPELYELLVLRQHWPLERFGRFVAESLVAALLPIGSG
jgi:hypothetical protein